MGVSSFKDIAWTGRLVLRHDPSKILELSPNGSLKEQIWSLDVSVASRQYQEAAWATTSPRQTPVVVNKSVHAGS